MLYLRWAFDGALCCTHRGAFEGLNVFVGVGYLMGFKVIVGVGHQAEEHQGRPSFPGSHNCLSFLCFLF